MGEIPGPRDDEVQGDTIGSPDDAYNQREQPVVSFDEEDVDLGHHGGHGTPPTRGGAGEESLRSSIGESSTGFRPTEDEAFGD